MQGSRRCLAQRRGILVRRSLGSDIPVRSIVSLSRYTIDIIRARWARPRMVEQVSGSGRTDRGALRYVCTRLLLIAVRVVAIEVKPRRVLLEVRGESRTKVVDWSAAVVGLAAAIGV